MPKALKFLTGFAAALAAGWISHGPLGRGEMFVNQLESDLQLVIANANLPGVTGRVQREPLARTAILSGPADQFQRDGMGSMPGINRRVLTVPGMARYEWTN
jgi:hypothetical protein